MRHVTALTAYDHAFAAFSSWGWDAKKAATVMAAIDYLVLGSAIETFKGGFDRKPADYAEDFPHLARALDGTRDDDVDDLGFELGLAALVAWLSARARERG